MMAYCRKLGILSWVTAATAAVLLAASSSSTPAAVAFVAPAAAMNKWTLPAASLLGNNGLGTVSIRGGALSSSSSSSSTTTSSTTAAADTPDILPDFSSLQDYEAYMETKAALPKGFATGTASGTFISQEAPALGELGIRATVIYLTQGATDNWAATFTKNKVREQ
jgi:hypothetical protein